ncbi:glycerol kinase [Clostridiales bacterium COT073_COT-073]|nr:glycerol kinase [Clostridiales bacterium COT073_COT-073]
MTIDEGTTSVRVVIVDHNGKVVGMAQNEFNQYYPHPGWIEQDPKEIWATTTEVINKSKNNAGVTDDDILAIGITNQRETCVLWDNETDLPVYPAIVWGDNRNEIADAYNKLREDGYEEVLKAKTGLVCDTEFSLLKVKWILDNVEGARKKADEGKLYFGTIDTWILWKLTKGREHKTDFSNASRTAMYNIHTLEWDQEILNKFNIPLSILPEVCSSNSHFGNTGTGSTFQKEIPIRSLLGDQMAATFGQACFNEGACKMTFGTAGVFDFLVGDKAVKSESGLLTSIAWGIDGKITYLLEGVVFNSGSTIQYIRDELNMIEAAPDSEYFAKKSKLDRGECYFLPMFSGMGAPFWDSNAKGTIFGLTRGVDKNDIIKAALDSLAYQTRDMVDAVIKDTRNNVNVLCIDGGASKNNLMAQFVADITGVKVDRPLNVETTASGAAYMAGLSIGFWKDFDEIRKLRKSDRVFKAEIDENERQYLYDGWLNCVDSLKIWGKGSHNIREKYNK